MNDRTNEHCQSLFQQGDTRLRFAQKFNSDFRRYESKLFPGRRPAVRKTRSLKLVCDRRTTTFYSLQTVVPVDEHWGQADSHWRCMAEHHVTMTDEPQFLLNCMNFRSLKSGVVINSQVMERNKLTHAYIVLHTQPPKILFKTPAGSRCISLSVAESPK